jgi:sulfhydrogenase subunit alpha
MVKEINLNHICKIEGHAHLTLKIEKNKVLKAELKAAEGARFFEALVLNKKLKDVQEIVSRICGICSCAHSVACVQALENAVGIKPNEKQILIRELLTIGERIRSHATHLYFLVLPDYLGYDSALGMMSKYPKEVNDAIYMISTGNKIVEVAGGREIHPFLDIKEDFKLDKKALDELVERLKESLKISEKTMKLFSELKYPELKREIDYLSLKDEKRYANISGKIVSKSGGIDVHDYKQHLKENIKEYATSKFVLKDDKPYLTGAIARVKNNVKILEKEIDLKKYMKKLEENIDNPFYNNLAQAIEMHYLIKKCVEILQELKNIGEINPDRKIKVKAGEGVSAVEAPRGTLFHEYKINNNGEISYCNIITPTAQNLNMMEQDIARYVDILLEKKASKEKIVREVEKLIRAYDPCFSCSTHFLKVKWLGDFLKYLK